MCAAIAAVKVITEAGGDFGILGDGVGSGEANGLGDAFGIGVAAGAFEHVLEARHTNVEQDREYGYGDDHFYQGKAARFVCRAHRHIPCG